MSMITNKALFKEYLQQDRERNIGSIPWYKIIGKKFLGTRDGILAYNYLKSLRRYEYALNCLKGHGIFGSFLYVIARYNHARLSQKYNINIQPNMVGKGIRLPHIIGGGIIINCLAMGDYCTVNTNVVVGKKNSDDERPIIGNNVDLCVGCKVIGKVTVGDNVTVAPNAVVISSIESGEVVGGIPARSLNKKYNDDINNK